MKLISHPSEPPVNLYAILKLKIIDRKSNKDISEALHRAQSQIYTHLKDMGLLRVKGVGTCYSLGELFDREAFRNLQRICGLSTTQMAEVVGLSFARVDCALSRRSRPKELHFDIAKAALIWRDRLFRTMMSSASRYVGKKALGTGAYSQSRVIRTFFPNLRDRYLFLIKVLHRLGDTLSAKPNWSPTQLERHLCEQAILEQKGISKGNLYRSFLPWAPELMPFISQKLQDVRGSKHKELTYKILGEYLGTSIATISILVNAAQAANVRAISPDQMRWEILSVDQEKHANKRKPRKRGRKKENEETKTYYKVGLMVETRIPATLKNDRFAIVTARREVEASRGFQPGVVAQYHRAYRRYCQQNGIEIPA
jgi:hypothetical protein